MPRRVCIGCNRVPIPTAKTFSNHGRAFFRMGEYGRAIEKLQFALRLQPNNVDTIKEIQLANEKQRKYMVIEKQLWRKCLKTYQQREANMETSFEKAVREMCENFSRDTQLLRLTVTTHRRYGREVTYLILR